MIKDWNIIETKPKEPDYGFRYKSIRNRMSFWWDHRKHTCDHCTDYKYERCGEEPDDPACKCIIFSQEIEEKQFILEAKWHRMTHLKQRTTWHRRLDNFMLKKDINQLLCENKVRYLCQKSCT